MGNYRLLLRSFPELAHPSCDRHTQASSLPPDLMTSLKTCHSTLARALAVIVILASCSGGTDGGTGPDPDPVVVVLNPGRDTVSVNGSLQFQASVTGSSNDGITWSLREGASAGTISVSGSYTAGSSGGLFGVIAASQADPASSDTSLVLVVPLPVATVTAPDSVLQNGAGLTASVPAQSGTFHWTINGGSMVSGDNGRLVTFTAGSSGPVQLQCVVTSLAGVSATGNSTTLTVAPPTIVSWTAERDTITDGERATLTPVFANGTATVNQGIGSVTSGTPIQSATLQFSEAVFTLTVTGFRGAAASASATVVPVDPPLIFSFESVSRSTAIGDGAYLKALWFGDAGVTASVDHGIGSLSSSVFQTGPLSSSTLFTLTVKNAADSALTDTVTALTEPAAAGSFSTVGTLTKGRVNGTATRLADGRVLFVGGRDSVGNILADAEILDPGTGTSSATGSMGGAREFHTAVLLNDGRVLVTGAGSSSNAGQTAEIFDPTTGTFSPAGSMSSSRFNHTMTVLQDGRVLIAGGDITSRSAEIFDPAAGTFTLTDSLLAFRFKFSAFLLPNGKVLILGGNGSSGAPTASTELYDPVLVSFSSSASMNSTHGNGSFTALSNGKILIAGGVGPDGLSPTGMAELYDPGANTFTLTGQLALPRFLHGAALGTAGTVLIVGGSSFDVPAGMPAEVFDPAQGKFIPAAHPAVSRIWHYVVSLLSGDLLIAGGVTAGPGGGQSFPVDVEIFQ